ncbi:MAG: hypothetical protein IPK24_00410 [Kineosporiaceae bacterium]|nr:hypothetical protein [Kineosporiaceae bacterium]MBK8074035.1 hypothetical protein [Kineosporiaceae bacterium]
MTASRPTARRGLRTMAVIAGAIGLGLFAVGLWGTLGDSPTSLADNPVSAVSHHPTASAGPGVARGGPIDATPAGVASSGTWAECETELQSAALTLDAGRAAALHWGRHVGAQQGFDRGTVTSAQAKAIWKETKAEGPQDLVRWAGAKTRYDQDEGACASARSRTSSGGSAGQGDACVAAAQIVDRAVGAAAAVVADWSAHLDMMAHDEHNEAYLERWAGMVAAAPKHLDAFDAALVEVDHAPTCTTPSP